MSNLEGYVNVRRVSQLLSNQNRIKGEGCLAIEFYNIGVSNCYVNQVPILPNNNYTPPAVAGTLDVSEYSINFSSSDVVNNNLLVIRTLAI